MSLSQNTKWRVIFLALLLAPSFSSFLAHYFPDYYNERQKVFVAAFKATFAGAGTTQKLEADCRDMRAQP